MTPKQLNDALVDTGASLVQVEATVEQWFALIAVIQTAIPNLKEWDGYSRCLAINAEVLAKRIQSDLTDINPAYGKVLSRGWELNNHEPLKVDKPTLVAYAMNAIALNYAASVLAAFTKQPKSGWLEYILLHAQEAWTFQPPEYVEAISVENLAALEAVGKRQKRKGAA